ncbi:MAG: hypothetical protein JXQ87_02040 [Bacteroidia bacterium]
MATILVATTCFIARAQPNEKLPIFLKSYGISGFGFLDITSVVYKDLSNSNNLKRAVVPSILSISYGIRTSLYEKGDHFSLSIETNPILQISASGLHNGYLSLGALEVPIMLSVNWGAASTFRSVDFFGGGFSVGLSLFRYPLVSINQELEFEDTGFRNYELLYCFSYKIRRWTMKNSTEGRAKSLELYFALGNEQVLSNQGAIQASLFGNRTVRAGVIFRKLLNY